MNLLFSNDQRGTYPQSWYAATADPLAPFPVLRGETRADVCIVGAGYTGLSAALHLAQAGLDVVVVEAHRVGFGASGRNGGQLGSGQRVEQDVLESRFGRVSAKVLWDMGEDAKALVKDLIATHEIPCFLKPGVLHTVSRTKDMAYVRQYAERLQRDYSYDQVEALEADACAALCPSPDYKGGLMDWGAGHLHPLRFALGLAKAAAAAGARIYERSHVHHIAQGDPAQVRTDAGQVRASHVILACNGYLAGLNRNVAAKVMPINNFIIATKPLGTEAARVLTQDIAVADSRFVVNYFRLSHDNRLLFGGGESYGYRFPRDIAGLVRKPLSLVFPHLRDVAVEFAWGGTLAITMTRLPYLARIGPNILSASGYSGHGVGSATQAGRLLAHAIEGQAGRFDVLANLPAQSFPGGTALRSPVLALAMTWYALRDRLGI